jgi:hypothetical protein
LKTVEEALETREPQVKKAIDYKWAKIRGKFIEAANEKIQHIIRFGDEYPKQLRYAFVIQLYIALEGRGKALCNEINKRNKHLPLTLNDLQGRGKIEGIRTFLSKVYPIPDVTDELWQDLDDLRVIRNCLVHKNGEIDPGDKDAKRLKQIIAKKQGVKVDHIGSLGIERFYCDKALQSVTAFFQTVFEQAGFGVSYFKWKAEWATSVDEELAKRAQLAPRP